MSEKKSAIDLLKEAISLTFELLKNPKILALILSLFGLGAGSFFMMEDKTPECPKCPVCKKCKTVQKESISETDCYNSPVRNP